MDKSIDNKLNEILGIVKDTNSRLSVVEADVKELKEDVKALKADVRTLKSDMKKVLSFLDKDGFSNLKTFGNTGIASLPTKSNTAITAKAAHNRK